LLQKAVDAHALREHVEIDRPQPFDHREPHCLRDQPSGQHDNDREQQLGQELAELVEEYPQRLER
jgi:hypothetical protein